MSEFHNEDGATISVDNFNVTAGNDFSNGIYATINADNFNVSAKETLAIIPTQLLVQMILASPQILLSILVQKEMEVLLQIHLAFL